MSNKNTLKVRARRLRRAHDRKVAAIKLADDRVKLAASLDAMVTIVGSVDLVRGTPGNDTVQKPITNLPIYKIQGDVVCLCRNHVFNPEGNDVHLNHIVNPNKSAYPLDVRYIIEDFKSVTNKEFFCLVDFRDGLEDLNAFE